MKKDFNNVWRLVRDFAIISGLVVSGVFVSCAGDDPITPKPPVGVVKDTTTYNIATEAELVQKLPQITADANNKDKYVRLFFTSKIGLNSGMSEPLKSVNSLADKIKIDWKSNFIYPMADSISLVFEDWIAMGKSPLGKNSVAGFAFYIKEQDIEKFKAAGVKEDQIFIVKDNSWQTGEIDIETIDGLAAAAEKAAQAAAEGHSYEKAASKSALVVGNDNVADLEKLAQYVSDVSAVSIAPKTDSVAVCGNVVLKYSFSSGENGNYIYTSKANGAENIYKSQNIGSNIIKTDSVFYGENGEGLSATLPRVIVYNVHGADAKNLGAMSKHKGRRMIELMPVKDASLPGGQAGLGNVGDEVFNILTTPATPYKSSETAVLYAKENPIVSTYTTFNYSDKNVDITGAPARGLSITTFGDSIGTNGSIQIIAASNAAVNKGLSEENRLAPHTNIPNGKVNVGTIKASEYLDANGRTYISPDRVGMDIELINRVSPVIPIYQASDINLVVSEILDRGIMNMSASYAEYRDNLCNWVEKNGLTILNHDNIAYTIITRFPENKKAR